MAPALRQEDDGNVNTVVFVWTSFIKAFGVMHNPRPGSDTQWLRGDERQRFLYKAFKIIQSEFYFVPRVSGHHSH